MMVSVIENNNKVATKFVSKDLSIGHLISRQQLLIVLYVIVSIVKLKYTVEWPNLKYINPICLFLLVRAPIRDSVESIASQGIQISCSGGLLLLPGRLNDALFSSTRFIPQDEIEDIFINEAFKGLQVIYYLAVLVSSQDKLLVLFEVCHVT
ncbi:unnamed protein product [Kluyveromyces dobzhanskii CBS 2104]|uniref:WGS project CCBQ000000000 data, contig 00017 n=1 Tax=Kluyveromyces dobzhanskii CBS 2104 TaxID=1427455 RepID=A0A0A8L673_9SACH|nr:unnamed protein product [Kluyveromyces dobzhanskii CBS 2104]